ncbi:MAG: ABC transporter ATP-binding protein, partial [Clostridia bacterium]|nr:ABC transporter ATP-binding protein [Clostridia bacterium]
MLKRFLSYYKPHKKLLVLDMLAALLISLTGMVYPVITNLMLNDLIPNFKYKLIVVAGLCVLALYVLRMLMQ